MSNQTNEAMMNWSREWILDGDLCRCRKCNRGIVLSRMGETFIHASGCDNYHLIAPWQDLRSRITAPFERSRSTGVEEGK